jgi:Bacterial regulatory helix-turn-helix protein, lysR family
MRLNLHLLRLFATLVQTGCFSRAADMLHINQPAISKGVRDFRICVLRLIQGWRFTLDVTVQRISFLTLHSGGSSQRQSFVARDLESEW